MIFYGFAWCFGLPSLGPRVHWLFQPRNRGRSSDRTSIARFTVVTGL